MHRLDCIYGLALHHKHKGSLIKFSTQLNSGTTSLIGINYLHKIDSIDILNKISKPLLSAWINGWQAEVDNVIIMNERNQYKTFN